VRKMLRNVQPAVGRDASRDRLSQEDAVFGVSSTDVVLHADDRYGLSIYDARAFGIQRGNPGVAFESMSLESRDHCVANTSCVLVFAPREDRRAGARDRAAERSVSHRAVLHVLKAGDQDLALRL